MTVKTRILDELGERRLALPALIDGALAANDRVKLVMTILQAARLRAAHPEEEAPDLRREREAAGVDDPGLDDVVAGSREVGDGMLRVPEAARLLGMLADGVEEMLAPLRVLSEEDRAAGVAAHSERLQRLRQEMPLAEGDVIPAAWIADATRGRVEEGDSLHVLIMDLHRELNRLHAETARESIAGARVHALEDRDRPLVEAFMAGLSSTAHLKFDHPGLGTTAARIADRLVIQNDIGTTDAHVLVLHVDGLTLDVTYTDVHAARAQFFMDQLEPCGLGWEDTRWRRARHFEDGAYVLCSGRLDAADERELAASLTHVGSRVVFLIDWNRARKQLRQLVRKRDAIQLLKEAADAGWGHRAFLELGGARLVHDAVQQASPTTVPLGRRLDELLGREAALETLRFVMRTACEALVEGRSARLVRDGIRAELLPRFHTVQEELLRLVGRHAELLFETATGVRDALVEAELGGGRAVLDRLAARAARWERDADGLLVRARETSPGAPGRDAHLGLLSCSDDAVDSLEEVAHLVTLLPDVGDWSVLAEPMRSLADLVLEAVRELVRCVASALHVHRGGEREDLQDVLESVDRVVALEHRTDEALRDVTARLVRDSVDHRQLHLCSRIAGELEEAADAISRCALGLRDHLLRELARG